MTISDEEISRWRETIDAGFCLSTGGSSALLDEVVRLRAECERACKVIESWELDYDRVVVRGEKCAMELAVEEAERLRAACELNRMKVQAFDEAIAFDGVRTCFAENERLRAENAELRKALKMTTEYIRNRPYSPCMCSGDCDGECQQSQRCERETFITSAIPPTPRTEDAK